MFSVDGIQAALVSLGQQQPEGTIDRPQAPLIGARLANIVQVLLGQTHEMRLSRAIQRTGHLEQRLRRKIAQRLQGFEPADNLIERPKRVILGQFADRLAQFAWLKQGMNVFRRKDPTQHSQPFEHFPCLPEACPQRPQPQNGLFLNQCGM